ILDPDFMELIDKIRKYENLHIVFWLIKDICWMLETKWLGALMIAPTLAVAVYIIIKTWRMPDVYINLAIFFWIAANSYWMGGEFFFQDQNYNYAAISFSLGFLFVGNYYFGVYKRKLSGLK